MPVSVGIGYDSHRFGEDRPLILGGVEVPYRRGLVGHSDADVLTHAVIDALLGAAGLGDIGEVFPDDDPQWEGADSIGLLSVTSARVSVKATTNEGMGWIGRGEGIAALAVASMDVE
jgi:2C-methyl-D-erythritol 2,4-cyclodiphosphate synthase